MSFLVAEIDEVLPLIAFPVAAVEVTDYLIAVFGAVIAIAIAAAQFLSQRGISELERRRKEDAATLERRRGDDAAALEGRRKDDAAALERSRKRDRDELEDRRSRELATMEDRRQRLGASRATIELIWPVEGEVSPGRRAAALALLIREGEPEMAITLVDRLWRDKDIRAREAVWILSSALEEDSEPAVIAAAEVLQDNAKSLWDEGTFWIPYGVVDSFPIHIAEDAQERLAVAVAIGLAAGAKSDRVSDQLADNLFQGLTEAFYSVGSARVIGSACEMLRLLGKHPDVAKAADRDLYWSTDAGDRRYYSRVVAEVAAYEVKVGLSAVRDLLPEIESRIALGP